MAELAKGTGRWTDWVHYRAVAEVRSDPPSSSPSREAERQREVPLTDSCSFVAQAFATEWTKMAMTNSGEGRHAKLAYQDEDSWGTLCASAFHPLLALDLGPHRERACTRSRARVDLLSRALADNLFGDRALNLNLFGRDLYEDQTAFYERKLERYGLPLDHRHRWAKVRPPLAPRTALELTAHSSTPADSPPLPQTDWQMLAAASSTTKKGRDGFVDNLVDFLAASKVDAPFPECVSLFLHLARWICALHVSSRSSSLTVTPSSSLSLICARLSSTSSPYVLAHRPLLSPDPPSQPVRNADGDFPRSRGARLAHLLHRSPRRRWALCAAVARGGRLGQRRRPRAALSRVIAPSSSPSSSPIRVAHLSLSKTSVSEARDWPMRA